MGRNGLNRKHTEGVKCGDMLILMSVSHMRTLARSLHCTSRRWHFVREMINVTTVAQLTPGHVLWRVAYIHEMFHLEHILFSLPHENVTL